MMMTRRLMIPGVIIFACGICAVCVPCALAYYDSKILKKVESLEKKESKDKSIRRIVLYKAENVRDPFKESDRKKTPVVVKKPVEEYDDTITLPGTFTVSGVIWGTKIPQAIINGKLVKVGDMMGEVRVLDISQAGIRVYYKSHNFTLPSPAVVQMKAREKKGGTNAK